jgi:hypothetical protein
MKTNQILSKTRQKVADMQIALARYLVGRGLAVNREVAVLPWGQRRADLLAMDFKGTQVIIVEQKSSVSDYTTDKKMHEYLPHCTSFYVAFTEDTWALIQKRGLVPENPRIGILVLTPFPNYWKYSVKVVRPAKKDKVPADVIHSLALRLAYRGARWRSKEDVQRGGNKR